MLLRVPCQNGSLVAFDSLPDDVPAVVSFLESEGVPLSHWWDIARAYLAQGRTEQYLSLCSQALEDELIQAVEEFFKRRPTFEIVQLQVGVAAHELEAARLESGDRAARAKRLAAAAERIAKAKAEGPDEQLPYLAGALLALAKVRFVVVM